MHHTLTINVQSEVGPATGCLGKVEIVVVVTHQQHIAVLRAVDLCRSILCALFIISHVFIIFFKPKTSKVTVCFPLMRPSTTILGFDSAVIYFFHVHACASTKIPTYVLTRSVYMQMYPSIYMYQCVYHTTMMPHSLLCDVLLHFGLQSQMSISIIAKVSTRCPSQTQLIGSIIDLKRRGIFRSSILHYHQPSAQSCVLSAAPLLTYTNVDSTWSISCHAKEGRLAVGSNAHNIVAKRDF